jgi:hypothetical protein
MAKKKTNPFDSIPSNSQDPLFPIALVSYRAELEWKDGIPHLVNAPVRLSEAPASAMTELLKKVLDLPYETQDASLQGLSNGEAMIVNWVRQAAAGDDDARTGVLDRLMGKPKQSIESVSLTGNLNDFLDSVAEKTRTQTIDITVKAEVNDVEDL